MIPLLVAVLLAGPPPPPPEPPLGVPPGPQPTPVLQTLDPWDGSPRTQIDSMCDHGNRIYRWLNITTLTESVINVFLVPHDPSCPVGAK